MKTVIEMAREAELVYWMSNLAQTNGRWWMDAGEPGEELERFAELIRADAIAEEREACAKLCGELHIEGEDDTGLAADLIRARSNK